MKLLTGPVVLIKDHRRSLTVIAAAYLALFLVGILITVIVPQLRPEGLGGLASSQGATGLGQIVVSTYSSIFSALGALGGVDVGVFGLGGLFSQAWIVWGDLDGDATSDFAVLVSGSGVSAGGWLL